MAYEAYRVRKRFQWRGWEFAPPGDCDCGRSVEPPAKPGDEPVQTCPHCTGQVGTGCGCRHTICRCACGIPATTFGGDIWLVEAGHERKAMLLLHRFAIGDASIPPVDELLKDPRYSRLVTPPDQAAPPKAREMVTATKRK